MKRVLILTYYWPPGSGAGVQRWLKFAKYLPAEGWEPVILTTDPEYATYPVTDSSLENEVDPRLKVFRTKTTDWFRLYSRDKAKIPSAGFASNGSKSITGEISKFIRGNFFIPDPRSGWNKYAVKEAARLIKDYDIRHLITTSPPHSTQLAGLELKKMFPGIKWLADLRDPWTDIYYYKSFHHTAPARKLDARYEKDVLDKADHIITVGPALKELFSARLPGIKEKISVITNGYDAEDFNEESPGLPGTFTISYIGTLSAAYPIQGFTAAVDSLATKGYKINLRFVGTVSADQRTVITSKMGTESTEFLPHVSHREAVRFMRGSSALLLVLPDHASNKCIITGKLFEYLAACRPILCIGPTDGDAADILISTGHGECATYNDTERIAQIIEKFGQSSDSTFLKAPEEFSRNNLTKKLSRLF